MNELLKKMLFIQLFVLAFYASGYAQIEGPGNTKSIAKDDITCFYMIDRVYTDPRNPDKRTVVGGVNFFQVEDGKISVGARTPRTSFFFNGTVDSLETVIVDGVSVIRIHATNNFNSPTIYPYVFEISQPADGPVTISARRKRSTSFLYFFDVHKASAREIAETRANAAK
ncbi:hypothetical protein [Fluviicola chungangensis]|uniref:Uncharacterized protein n=1 Tax=Fluviicola chungangensis TaxID=2597671 RepID=A0A556N0H8_9FLAO|nr:hypothetical protein [Fluviicola chungangensis]TSJ45666.1 hypothetical protein FO442_07910 [Fluviicola chungangensis]